MGKLPAYAFFILVVVENDGLIDDIATWYFENYFFMGELVFSEKKSGESTIVKF
jgi:hypothetical protein